MQIKNNSEISWCTYSCCSVAKSCPALWDPTNFSTPDFSIHRYLPEFDQTYVHWVSDAIQPSPLLSPPSPLALKFSPALGSFPMSQFFTSGGQSIGASASASVLAMNIQGWFPLGLTGLISVQSKGLSRDSSSITAQKCQLLDLLYGPTLTYDYWKNHNFDYTGHIL